MHYRNNCIFIIFLERDCNVLSFVIKIHRCSDWTGQTFKNIKSRFGFLTNTLLLETILNYHFQPDNSGIPLDIMK